MTVRFKLWLLFILMRNSLSLDPKSGKCLESLDMLDLDQFEQGLDPVLESLMPLKIP